MSHLGTNPYAALASTIQMNRKPKPKTKKVIQEPSPTPVVSQEPSKKSKGFRTLSLAEQKEFFQSPVKAIGSHSESTDAAATTPEKKPYGPAKDMDPEERKNVAKKFNSYIGNGKHKDYMSFLKTRNDVFPYLSQICYFNNSKRAASVCYLDKEWCPFAHDKQHSEPFQMGICMHDITGKCRSGKKCNYLHASFFTSDGAYPGIYEEGTEDEPGDEAYPIADQRRILILTRHRDDKSVIFTRCSWNRLLEILKEDATRIFKSTSPETDYFRIRFWAVKWRNCDTDPWTLVIIDDSITKARQWRLLKKKE